MNQENPFKKWADVFFPENYEVSPDALIDADERDQEGEFSEAEEGELIGLLNLPVSQTNGADFLRLRELLILSPNNRNEVPLTKEWMESTPDGTEIRALAVQIANSINHIIGETGNIAKNDFDAIEVEERNINLAVQRLRELGVTSESNTQVPKIQGEIRMASYTTNSKIYVRNFAENLLRGLPDTAVHSSDFHENNLEDRLTDEDSDDAFAVNIKEFDDTSPSRKKWEYARAVPRMVSMFFDAKSDLYG